MTALGSYSGWSVIKAFEKAGWRVSRQRGSHVILHKTGSEVVLSIPVHGSKSVKRGTLRNLIRDAGMTIEEFMNLIK